MTMVEDHQVQHMTEEEAELYDRQIRLWGVEAQNRMKKSKVLIINLGGIAMEICKNLVLAGIGSLTILDTENVSSSDLGAGFFFRDLDIGLKRVEVAKTRIKSLNPRVEVKDLYHEMHLSEDLGKSFVDMYDVICLTDSTAPFIKRVNEYCRDAGKPFFTATSLGINGYIFSDLINHTYIQEKETSTENGEIKKTKLKKSQSFLPFDTCLKSKLNHVTPKRFKKVSPILWCCLALLEYQMKHASPNHKDLNYGVDKKQEETNYLKEKEEFSDELIEISRQIFKNQHVFDETLLPIDVIKQVSKTYKAEFVPTCAIIGSIVSQEILNFLAAQQAPLTNFFVFDGQRSAGDIYALGVQRSTA